MSTRLKRADGMKRQDKENKIAKPRQNEDARQGKVKGR